MLEYDSTLDQYIEVVFDECSDSSEEENEATIRRRRRKPTVDPVLVLTKRRLSKSRSTIVKLFNPARVVRKSGRLNVSLTKLPNKSLLLYYIRDLGNTLLTMRWRWILLTLVLVNFGCFLVFSVLWWITAWNSGDFQANHTGFVCTVNARTMTGYLLLSIETVTTIGYGYRYPTEYCQGGWIMLMLQALFNIFIQGALVSTVYVKVTKPFTYISSSLFSKTAVICMRNGKLRFIFRIHDFHRKIWCGTSIALYFLDKEIEGDLPHYQMIKMKIEPHGLLIFPLEIEHVIDERSPLWSFRPLDILQTKYEIIAVAEGSSNITGKVSQNRTSYSNSDIFWGHRFRPCVNYDESIESFVVDYKKFKQTLPFDTPLCSAKKLADIYLRLEESEGKSN